jgi:hypothetical protein
VRRIIYLGGLADDAASLSPHLRSRAETGRHLRAAGVPVVEFRASIVIGAGSLSFEMIRALVERLPVMICPRWVNTPAQPIAVDDVVRYLAAAVELAGDGDRTFDIGGPEVVSYGDMMRLYARLRGLRRLLLSVPVLTPRLSGLWLGLVAPAQARIGRPLVEGLKNATVVRDPGARSAFAIDPMPLSQAFARAIADGAAAWSKSDVREVEVDASPARAFAADPAHRRGQRLVCGRPALARSAAGSIASPAAPACAGAASRATSAPWATPSTTGRSKPTSPIGGFASTPISVCRPRLARVPGHAARRRTAIPYPTGCHLRSARRARAAVLVRRPSLPCRRLRRPAARAGASRHGHQKKTAGAPCGAPAGGTCRRRPRGTVAGTRQNVTR